MLFRPRSFAEPVRTRDEHLELRCFRDHLALSDACDDRQGTSS